MCDVEEVAWLRGLRRGYMIFRIVDLVKAVNANVCSGFGNFQMLARVCEDETEVWTKVVKGPIDLMYSMHWSVVPLACLLTPVEA